jgi:hypothetical protein
MRTKVIHEILGFVFRRPSWGLPDFVNFDMASDDISVDFNNRVAKDQRGRGRIVSSGRVGDKSTAAVSASQSSSYTNMALTEYCVSVGRNIFDVDASVYNIRIMNLNMKYESIEGGDDGVMHIYPSINVLDTIFPDLCRNISSDSSYYSYENEDDSLRVLLFYISRTQLAPFLRINSGTPFPSLLTLHSASRALNTILFCINRDVGIVLKEEDKIADVFPNLDEALTFLNGGKTDYIKNNSIYGSDSSSSPSSSNSSGLTYTPNEFHHFTFQLDCPLKSGDSSYLISLLRALILFGDIDIALGELLNKFPIYINLCIAQTYFIYVSIMTMGKNEKFNNFPIENVKFFLNDYDNKKFPRSFLISPSMSSANYSIPSVHLSILHFIGNTCNSGYDRCSLFICLLLSQFSRSLSVFSHCLTSLDLLLQAYEFQNQSSRSSRSFKNVSTTNPKSYFLSIQMLLKLAENYFILSLRNVIEQVISVNLEFASFDNSLLNISSILNLGKSYDEDYSKNEKLDEEEEDVEINDGLGGGSHGNLQMISSYSNQSQSTFSSSLRLAISLWIRRVKRGAVYGHSLLLPKICIGKNSFQNRNEMLLQSKFSPNSSFSTYGVLPDFNIKQDFQKISSLHLNNLLSNTSFHFNINNSKSNFSFSFSKAERLEAGFGDVSSNDDERIISSSSFSTISQVLIYQIKLAESLFLRSSSLPLGIQSTHNQNFDLSHENEDLQSKYSFLAQPYNIITLYSLLCLFINICSDVRKNSVEFNSSVLHDKNLELPSVVNSAIPTLSLFFLRSIDLFVESEFSSRMSKDCDLNMISIIRTPDSFVSKELQGSVSSHDIEEEYIVATGFLGVCGIIYSAALFLWKLPHTSLTQTLSKSISSTLMGTLIKKLSQDIRSAYQTPTESFAYKIRENYKRSFPELTISPDLQIYTNSIIDENSDYNNTHTKKDDLLAAFQDSAGRQTPSHASTGIADIKDLLDFTLIFNDPKKNTALDDNIIKFIKEIDAKDNLMIDPNSLGTLSLLVRSINWLVRRIFFLPHVYPALLHIIFSTHSKKKVISKLWQHELPFSSPSGTGFFSNIYTSFDYYYPSLTLASPFNIPMSPEDVKSYYYHVGVFVNNIKSEEIRKNGLNKSLVKSKDESTSIMIIGNGDRHFGYFEKASYSHGFTMNHSHSLSLQYLSSYIQENFNHTTPENITTFSTSEISLSGEANTRSKTEHPSFKLCDLILNLKKDVIVLLMVQKFILRIIRVDIRFITLLHLNKTFPKDVYYYYYFFFFFFLYI